ncbi:MAG: EAL domain-containing protein [Cyanobacteria bacterium P01_F01_bin.86]
MTTLIDSNSDICVEDLSALVQHELRTPLGNLQGAIRLLSTGRYGKLSREGSQLLYTAMTSLDRLNRLAIAVEDQPTTLATTLSPEQIRIFQLQNDLPGAIERKEINLAYQPIVCVETNTIVGFEALARWHHPVHGEVSPVIFIPLAEESGLIHQMSKQLIFEACQKLQYWQKCFPENQSLSVSVNLSVLQLSRLDLVDHIEQVLENTQINPQSLKLEITESALVENSEIAVMVLKRLKHLGIHLYLDDFGTGYSALSRLPSLPLDALKVDRMFVANKNWEICEVILSLAEKLKLNVIVEGVETPEEARILEEIGFKKMQGYFFSHSLTAHSAFSLLKQKSDSLVSSNISNQDHPEEMFLIN